MKSNQRKPQYSNWVSKWILRSGFIVTVLLTAGGVVAFELAGEFRFEVGRVEMSNGSCSAHTFLKVGEIFLNAVA